MKRAGAVVFALLAALMLWQAWPGQGTERGDRPGVDADGPAPDAKRGGPGAADGAAPPPDPPDTAARGTASLFLEVLSAQTRAVAPMEVDLFREARFVRTFATPGTAPDLAPAEYRVVCRGARFDSEDPPPFRVEGATRLQLVVPTPRAREVTLLVVDRHGRPVREGMLHALGLGRRVKDHNPKWAVGKADYEVSTEWMGHDGEPESVRSADGVYALGRAWDDDRVNARTWQYLFRAGDGNVVEVRVRGVDLADRYVGAVVPRDELLRPVVTPSGEPVARLDPRFSGHCLAMPWAGEATWRGLEVSVGVEVEGLPEFRYAYVVGDPPEREEMWSEPPPVPR